MEASFCANSAAPMSIFVAGSNSASREGGGRAARVAIASASAGMICISPTAPAFETVLGSNPLSCRVMAMST